MWLKKPLKRIRTAISFAMAVMLLLTMPSMKVFAAEEIITVSENVVVLEAQKLELPPMPEISLYATTFVEAQISVSYESDGMHIGVTVYMNKPASVVGVKDVIIQKKHWYGWETVGYSNGVEAIDRQGVGGTLVYPGAQKGETYRVSCIFYGDVDGYREMESTTSGYPYT